MRSLLTERKTRRSLTDVELRFAVDAVDRTVGSFYFIYGLFLIVFQTALWGGPQYRTMLDTMPAFAWGILMALLGLLVLCGSIFVHRVLFLIGAGLSALLAFTMASLFANEALEAGPGAGATGAMLVWFFVGVMFVMRAVLHRKGM